MTQIPPPEFCRAQIERCLKGKPLGVMVTKSDPQLLIIVRRAGGQEGPYEFTCHGQSVLAEFTLDKNFRLLPRQEPFPKGLHPAQILKAMSQADSLSYKEAQQRVEYLDGVGVWLRLHVPDVLARVRALGNDFKNSRPLTAEEEKEIGPLLLGRSIKVELGEPPVIEGERIDCMIYIEPSKDPAKATLSFAVIPGAAASDDEAILSLHNVQLLLREAASGAELTGKPGQMVKVDGAIMGQTYKVVRVEILKD